MDVYRKFVSFFGIGLYLAIVIGCRQEVNPKASETSIREPTIPLLTSPITVRNARNYDDGGSWSMELVDSNGQVLPLYFQSSLLSGPSTVCGVYVGKFGNPVESQIIPVNGLAETVIVEYLKDALSSLKNSSPTKTLDREYLKEIAVDPRYDLETRTASRLLAFFESN